MDDVAGDDDDGHDHEDAENAGGDDGGGDDDDGHYGQVGEDILSRINVKLHKPLKLHSFCSWNLQRKADRDYRLCSSEEHHRILQNCFTGQTKHTMTSLHLMILGYEIRCASKWGGPTSVISGIWNASSCV